MLFAIGLVLAVPGSASAFTVDTWLTGGGWFLATAPDATTTKITLAGELPCVMPTGTPSENQNLTLRATGFSVTLRDLTLVDCTSNDPTRYDGGALTAEMTGTCNGVGATAFPTVLHATLRLGDSGQKATGATSEKFSDFADITLATMDDDTDTFTPCAGDYTGFFGGGDLTLQGEITGFETE